MTLDWINVKDKGAIGNGIADDTAAIQAAVADAVSTKVGVVYIPQGKYKVTSTIYLENYSTVPGVMIIGGNPYYDVSPNATGTQILSTLTVDNPVFSFVGNSGSHGNAGLKNINITATTSGNGCGIYIDGSCFCIFDNIRLIALNKGMWLKNTGGNSAEQNLFSNLRVEYCNTFLKFTKGSTDPKAESFHGCSFENMFVVVGSNMKGVEMDVGSAWYNGKFDSRFWTPLNFSSPVIVANGNCYNLHGNVTIEGYCLFQGSGLFNFFGNIDIFGTGFQDNSVYGNTGSVTCTTYFKGMSPTNKQIGIGNQRELVLKSNQDPSGPWNKPIKFITNNNQSFQFFTIAFSFNAVQNGVPYDIEADLLYFNNFISRRIIITSGDIQNAYAPAASMDIIWHINSPNDYKFNTQFRNGWNGQWSEFVDIVFNNNGGNKKLALRSNPKIATTYFLHFSGVKF